MYDPTTQMPTVALINHIWNRYHDTHRREMPGLIALANKVETVHATDPNTPHGLTDALKVMFAELEDHMRDEEETVFTALQTERPASAVSAVPSLREAHDGHEAALNRIAAITHGFRLPHHACQSWRRLYVGLGKLVEDLDEHMYLENEVLFPRIEMRV